MIEIRGKRTKAEKTLDIYRRCNYINTSSGKKPDVKI